MGIFPYFGREHPKRNGDPREDETKADGKRPLPIEFLIHSFTNILIISERNKNVLSYLLAIQHFQHSQSYTVQLVDFFVFVNERGHVFLGLSKQVGVSGRIH